MRVRVYALILLLSAVALPGGAQPPTPDANAALQYWQAFGLMPTLDKEQEKLLENWSTAPLDAAAEKLLAAGNNSLMYLRRAAKAPRCDWGLDYNDGISLLLPHLARARDLGRLGALRARQHFEHGRWAEGRDDATAVLALARHAGRDPILISILVGYLIDGAAVDAIAPYVGAIPARHADVVAALDSLPPAATPARAVRFEKEVMTRSIIRQLREAERRRPNSWRDTWAAMTGPAVVPEAVNNAESLDGLIAKLEALAPLYDELATLAEQPAAEFDSRFPEFERKTKAANPLAGVLFPAMSKVRAKEHRARARSAMLLAAFAVAEGGPDRLKEIKDPFGDGPFGYRALDAGFELSSKLTFEGKPVTLTAGQRAKRP